MKKICVSLLLVIFTSHLHAQNDLNHYLSHAFKADPSIHDNKNMVQIENLEIQRVHAEYQAPKIYLTSDILLAPYFNNNGKFFSSNPQPGAIGYDIGITNGGLYSGLVNATIPVFNNRRIKILNESSEIKIKNNLYNIELRKHTLKKTVTDRYLLSLNNYQQLKKNREIIQLLSEQKEIVDKLVRNGILNQSDYILINIEYNTQLAVSRQLQANYKNNILQLNTICGIRDTNTVFLAPLTLDLVIEPAQKLLMESFLIDSLRVRADQKIFDSKYLPDFSIFSNTGLNAVALPDIENKFGLSAGLSFSWNIFDGNQKKISASKSKIRQNTIAAKKNYFRYGTQLQLNSDLQQIMLIKQKILLLEQQEEDFQDLLEVYKIQLEKGQLSVIDYINTLKAFIDMQTNIVNSKTSKQLLINDYNYWNW